MSASYGCGCLFQTYQLNKKYEEFVFFVSAIFQITISYHHLVAVIDLPLPPPFSPCPPPPLSSSSLPPPPLPLQFCILQWNTGPQHTLTKLSSLVTVPCSSIYVLPKLFFSLWFSSSCISRLPCWFQGNYLLVILLISFMSHCLNNRSISTAMECVCEKEIQSHEIRCSRKSIRHAYQSHTHGLWF